MAPRAEADEPSRIEWDVVVAVAVGGVVGAQARYGLGVLAPHAQRDFGWMTLAINVVGCLLMGVLIGLLERLRSTPRLARPLLATGVLGGFTTFSAYAVDVVGLAHAGRWWLAVAYLVLSVLSCLAAVATGFAVSRR